MLIGFLPVLLLIYVGIDLYDEKKEQIELIKLYRQRIDQSALVSRLIDNLQRERKSSFDFAVNGDDSTTLSQLRPTTDSIISVLLASEDVGLKQFTIYTNLKGIDSVRSRIDNGSLPAPAVMHFYTNAIFRLNTLNTIPTSPAKVVEPVHKDMIAQKILSEMITYLGIIRANIYNVLTTKKYATETILGSVGAHDVYKSYITEFEVKAAPEIVSEYKQIASAGPLFQTHVFVDSSFKSLTVDTTMYSAADWWKVSNLGIEDIRQQKLRVWQHLTTELDSIYFDKKRDLNLSLALMLLTLVLAVLFTSYIIYIISASLRDLGHAARQLSSGVTNVGIKVESRDELGELASCIAEIDKTNKRLADAAEAIGKGDFNVAVKPRGERDVLGNAIAEMQKKLHRYKNRMESLVDMRTKELQRSNEDLQQFAHIASHDLKEPVRKIRTFSSRLVGETEKISDKGKQYIDKIQSASARMTGIIDGILSYSMVNASDEQYETIDLNTTMEGILSDLEVAIAQKSAKVEYRDLPVIEGIPVLIHQLLYNLVNNALKFSVEGRPPFVKVSGSSPRQEELPLGAMSADHVKITVADNGIGFSQEQAYRLFDLFTRLNSREKFEGTGLGLALCKKIVERHHGFIYAQGRDGDGATFTIILPRTAAEERKANKN